MKSADRFQVSRKRLQVFAFSDRQQGYTLLETTTSLGGSEFSKIPIFFYSIGFWLSCLFPTGNPSPEFALLLYDVLRSRAAAIFSNL
jgi:hypothetical protein